MKKIILVLTLITISSIIAFGQDDYKKAEVFVGYSNGQIDASRYYGFITQAGVPKSYIDRENFNGFEVSGVYNFNRYVGVKGDFSATYQSDNFSTTFANNTGGTTTFSSDVRNSVYNVLGGVQIKDNSKEKRVKPFAHALVGAGLNRRLIEITNAPSNGNTTNNNYDENSLGLACAFGGGVDIKLSNRIDLRAIQVDYNPIRFNGDTQNNIRIGVGLVFK